MLAVKVQKISVLQIRVELNLVDGRLDLCRLEDYLKVLLEKVGDTDRPSLAGFLDGFEICPFLLKLLGAICEVRRMDEIQIHVVQPQLYEGLLKSFLGVALPGATALGHNVELVPGHLGGLDGGTHLGLILVHYAASVLVIRGTRGRIHTLGTINVPEADLDSGLGYFDELFIECAIAFPGSSQTPSQLFASPSDLRATRSVGIFTDHGDLVSVIELQRRQVRDLLGALARGIWLEGRRDGMHSCDVCNA